MISVAVMAHPRRQRLTDELLQVLDAPAQLVLDRHNDEWDTGRRAWDAHDPSATHHLVLQDDAIPCLNLVAGLARALTYVPPHAIVSLYLGTRRPMRNTVQRAVDDARAQNAAWVVMPHLNWGVGVVLPTETIPDMLDHADRHPGRAYDRRIGRWYFENGWPTWCTWPSLVDHADGPSLNNYLGRRQAHWFAEGSALDVDWSAGAVRMDREVTRA
jgi:hypothetical protein